MGRKGKFMNSIKQTLIELNLIDPIDLELFSSKTRDLNNINVMRDKTSGVIFVDHLVPDDSVYERGEYRKQGEVLFGSRDYEIVSDVSRRIKDYEQYFVGKKVLDFGCGEGTFLKEIKASATEVFGCEIEKISVNHLNEMGINCLTDIKDFESESVDTIFCFHTLEHLKKPLEALKEFRRILVPKGHLVIEVPHANDFLLRYLKSEAFKNFTLWSQHLILHSRVSLKKFLSVSGFDNFVIQGKQRYPLSNHFYWLIQGKPGGHKSILSSLDTDDLLRAYEGSLQMIDATDTLIAVATKN